MNDIKKHIGESEIGKTPKKVTKIRIAEGAVTTDKLADQSVTVNKLAEDVTAAIQDIEHYGVMVSQELGNNTNISISQKKLTEEISAIQDDVLALGEKQDRLTFDEYPTQDSPNPVTSDGINAALNTKVNITDVYAKNETYSKSETYNRTEIGNMLDPTSIVVMKSSDFPPSSPDTDVVYRVQGTTDYTDRAYTGTEWVTLATYSNALDDTPTASSNNLVKSSGVYAADRVVDNNVITMQKSLITPAVIASGSGAPTTTVSNYTITDAGVIEYQSSDNFKFTYYNEKLSARTVVHFTATTSGSRTQTIGYVTTDPATASPITSLTVNILDRQTITGSWDVTVVIPQDAWLVYSINTANSYWSNRRFEIFNPGYAKEDLAEAKSFTDEAQYYTQTLYGAFVEKDTLVDADSTSETFGQAVSVDSTLYVASTNFIPVMGADKMTLHVLSSSTTEAYQGVRGVVGYNAAKEPIVSIQLTIADTADVGEDITIDVPAGVEYIRTACQTKYWYLYSKVILYYALANLRAEIRRNTSIVSETDSVAYSKGYATVINPNSSYYGKKYDCNNNNLSTFKNLIVVKGCDYIGISIRICNNSTGWQNYGSVFLDEDKVPLEGGVVGAILATPNNVSAGYSDYCIFAVPEGAVYFNATFYTPTGTTKTFYKYRLQSTILNTIEDQIANIDVDITDLDIYQKARKQQTIENISQAMWIDTDTYTTAPPSGAAATVSSRPGVMGLLHYSDWHESTVAGNAVLEWKSAIEKYYRDILGGSKAWVNDIINTGDVVENYLSNGTPDAYFNVEGLASSSLFVLGNHDQGYYHSSGNDARRAELFWLDAGTIGNGSISYYGTSGTPNINFNASGNEAKINEIVDESHVFSFTKYFSPYITGWGVTPPTGYNSSSSPYYQACYWHKDYLLGYKVSNDKPIGVRIIGLDCMYRFDGILKSNKTDNRITSFEANGSTVDFSDYAGNMLDKDTDAQYGDGFAKLTTEQETWLYNKLMETLDSNSSVYGYSVICLAHYPLDNLPGANTLDEDGCNVSDSGGKVLNYRTNDKVNFEISDKTSTSIQNDDFNMRNRERNTSYNYMNTSRTGHGFSKGSVNNMGDILQLFQDKGGEIIAWICGHTHLDHFYYPAKYPNILNVVIDRAGENRPNGVSRRSTADNSLCANFYAVDIINKRFKIVRLGLNMNSRLMPLNVLTYDYGNKKVLSEG